jgi:hypothetical protein
MNQRSGVVTFLVGGGAVIPLAVLGVIAAALGRAAFVVGLLLEVLGLVCLVHAKWPQLIVGQFLAFGPARLSPRWRKLYWLGYALIASGLVLACMSVPLRWR